MAKIRKLFEFIAVLGAMSFKTPMLKTPAMIVLSNFDRSWFADWVVSSKKKRLLKTVLNYGYWEVCMQVKLPTSFS